MANTDLNAALEEENGSHFHVLSWHLVSEQCCTIFCRILTKTSVTIVSMLRLKTLSTFNNDSPNPTWDFVDVDMLSNIEICVSIICSCLPTLRLMLARLFPRFWEVTRQNSPQMEFK